MEPVRTPSDQDFLLLFFFIATAFRHHILELFFSIRLRIPDIKKLGFQWISMSGYHDAPDLHLLDSGTHEQILQPDCVLAGFGQPVPVGETDFCRRGRPYLDKGISLSLPDTCMVT
jgi:hypothetical protein